LEVVAVDDLPEAVAGRPYRVALAARGGQGTYTWEIVGTLPEGLALDPATGVIAGTVARPLDEPVVLTLIVDDGVHRARGAARLGVLKADHVAPPPGVGRVAPALRSWLEQGFGFLVLGLAWWAGMGAVGSVERWSAARAGDPDARPRRFTVYRGLLSVTALGLGLALGAWLGRPASDPVNPAQVLSALDRSR
jgi:hypothetical protein